MEGSCGVLARLLRVARCIVQADDCPGYMWPMQDEALDRVYLTRWPLTDDRRSAVWFEWETGSGWLDVVAVDTGDGLSASARVPAATNRRDAFN